MCCGFLRCENRDMSLQVTHSNGAEVSRYPQLTSFSSYVSSGEYSKLSGIFAGTMKHLASLLLLVSLTPKIL